MGGTGIGGCREPGESDEERETRKTERHGTEAYARIIYKKPLITVIHDLGAERE